ncbi:hypothetical protein [Streptomyces sp. NBC_01238]|uniref:hypothetical protein n=1 Tax=Streptomyces sp. NBC_01238 TaxID=2903791 RepID=UPI002F916470
MTDIGAALARIEKRLERAERAARLSYASLDDTALEVRDGSGSLRGVFGQQGDGTTAVNVVNGPPPPQPSAPVVVSVLGGVTVSWDGTFADGAVLPLDWSRVEVHASPLAFYTPSTTTLKATIETAQGGTIVIATPDPVHVRLVARSTSGTASAPSTTVGPVGPTPVVATDILDGIVTTVKLADDAVTAAKVATGAIGTTKITDNAITTPKIVAGAVQAAQIDAEAVNASKIAAGAVTTAKLDALAVTANELAANAVTASKILAGSVSAQALTIGIAQSIVTKLTDTMADTSTWARVGETGTYTTVTGVGDAVAGATVMQVSGPASMERTENIPYDAAALYRFTMRLRTTLAPTAGNPIVYLGFTGIAADGTTRVNAAGANSVGSQHYVTAANLNIPVSTTWTTLTGYLQGTAATGTTTARPDPRTPGAAHTNVRYVRPLLRLLNGATGGTMQVDQVTVETVPTGAVNSVNIVDGAVTANSIAVNAITTTKLAAGSVDATALKADAITGKTISGGSITGTTITGGTVTGSTIQTATAGKRIALLPDGTMALYSGRTGGETPGSLESGITSDGEMQLGYLVLKPPTHGPTPPEITMAIGPSGERNYSVGPLLMSEQGSSGFVNLFGNLNTTGRADVSGIFTAGNIAFGTVNITTTTGNIPASALVSGLNVAGTTFRAFVTASSGNPGTQLLAVSANNQSSGGLTVWLNRTNAATTAVWWLLIGT